MTLGQTPHIHRGQQIDPKRLWASDPNIALTLEVTIPAGFGYLPPGTLMGAISSESTRYGQYVPYAIQTAAAGLTVQFGGAYLLVDGAADALCYVTMDDSYQFAVGDHLGAVDSDATVVDLGAVVSINRTTYSHMALITVTNDVTTAITIAAGGFIFTQTDTSSPYTTAVGILAGGVETGTGENAKGGEGVIVISNAILYKGLMPNYDSGALTDLSGVSLNNFIILK